MIWGHFYARPTDATWGSQDNPDLFVKIWLDVSGRVDVNFFHVPVLDIEVYSNVPGDGINDQKGTSIMADRNIRHEYQDRGKMPDLSLDDLPETKLLDMGTRRTVARLF